MKIFRKTVWQMTGEGMRLIPEESESFEYSGPIAECKKDSKAPPAPDPNVVSGAQTKSNQDTAAYQNALEHGNVTTPYGNQTFTGRVDPTTGATVYDQSISVAPEVQQLLDQLRQQDLSLGSTSQKMLGSVDAAYGQPLDTNGLPSRVGSVHGGPIQSELNTQGPDLVGSLDTNGLPKLYGADDLEGARQQVSDALYKRQTAFLDPQYQQRQQALDSKLANQGITLGSEAYKNAMDDENRAREFSYGQARDSSITGGLGELQGLTGIAQGNRAQMLGEKTTAGNFQNQARAQALSEALTRLGVNNDAQQQGFQQSLSSGNFQNQARTQALQEAITLRNQPLNEYNALRSSSQVNVPQFQNPQTPQVAPTDVGGNIWNAYNGNLNVWNAQQQGNNSFLSGLMGLGGTLGGAAITKSDARVKSNVKRIGLLPQGVGVYEYEYTGDPLREKQTGVMAQEVEQDDPEAVVIDRDGTKSVNYTRVLAKALMERLDAAA